MVFVSLLSIFRLSAGNIDSSDIVISCIHKFNRIEVRAISPDGSEMVIEELNKRGHLRLVEISSGKTINAYELKPRLLFVEFFKDNQALFFKTFDLEKTGVLDLRTGKLTSRNRDHSISSYVDTTSNPIHDRILLSRQSINRPAITDELVQVEFPSYREIIKVPYATGPREPPPLEDDPAYPASQFDYEISNDRNIIAYSYDHVLVCRRTKDLKVLWTRKIKPPLRAWTIAIAPNGEYVAADISDIPQRRGNVSIFEMETGTELTRVSVKNMDYWFAISPNGNLLATSERKWIANKEKVQCIVHVYDVQSGRELASVFHEELISRRDSGFTIDFTPDGRYLITSGINTKIWKLSGTAVNVRVTPLGISTD
jgi:hypothetical protein